MHYLERDRRTVMPGHDPRRPERVQRYQPGKQTDVGSPVEHINALGMVCSLLGLLMRVRVTLLVCQKSVKNLISFHYTLQLKWAAWIGVYCSLVYLANSRAADDKKQMLSLFM